METQRINWKVSKKDSDLISKILDRAVQVAASMSHPLDRLTLRMDLVAVHLNGCPLKLGDLLEAPLFDFTHDVWGIHRHIDRKTGMLKDCFLPRYAKPRLESEEFVKWDDAEEGAQMEEDAREGEGS